MIPPPYTEIPVVQPITTDRAYRQQQQDQIGPSPIVAQAYIVNQPAQIGYVNGCNQIFYTCSPAPVVYNEYKSYQSKLIGITQIIVGILCIAFNAAAIGIANYSDSGFSSISHGIWGGVFFIITGSFGVAAAERKSRCLIITFMVFCLISVAAATVILILSSLYVAIFRQDDCHYSYYYDSYGYYHNDYSKKVCEDGHAARLAMHSVLLILSVIEGILTIWGSIICCKVACCCSTKPQAACTINPQPVMLGSMNGNQQIIVLTDPYVMSQPGSNPVYPVTISPMYQPVSQPVNLAGDMNANNEEKRHPIPE